MIQKIKKMFQSQKGFTLVEVMIATAIFALGSVLIYQAFFVCLDSFNYVADYMSVTPWLNEKVWYIEESISRLGEAAEIQQEGSFRKRKTDFNWTVFYTLADSNGLQDLYKIDITLSWKRGRRNIKLLRSAHALFKHDISQRTVETI